MSKQPINHFHVQAEGRTMAAELLKDCVTIVDSEEQAEVAEEVLRQCAIAILAHELRKRGVQGQLEQELDIISMDIQNELMEQARDKMPTFHFKPTKENNEH